MFGRPMPAELDATTLAEIGQRATQQVMDLFINPEISRRQERGELPRPLPFLAAQVIFYPNERPPQVRINSEVRAIARVIHKPGVMKEPGDEVFANELASIEQITLTDSDDPDCGHATIIRLPDQWVLGVDFVYSKGSARRFLQTAEEFYATAETAWRRNHKSAFIENLFTAAELAIKALLLMLFSDQRFYKKTDHRDIHSRFNRFAAMGNVDPIQRNVFNKLSHLRYPARYDNAPDPLSNEEAESYMNAIQAIITRGKTLSVYSKLGAE